MRDGLALYNTMSGRKEPFRPRNPPHVSMFVCGPTVQAPMHLGHARTYIFYDALARYLRHLGFDVFFLMNITDIDETITEAARRVGEEPLEYSGRMSASFLSDMKALNIDAVTRFEPVSAHVEEMIGQVESLVARGFAYQAGGWVYYDTAKFRRWGRLSQQSKRELAHRPHALTPKKRNLKDFALCRPETLVDGRWKSPWGLGSPGWHIQDTAVTVTILGAQYDIHGGAYELIYPHHEAEIAEGESLTGDRPLVRYWVHTSLLSMEGLKMSKSLGNVVTVREALRLCTAEEIRLCFLSTHYRKGANLSSFGPARRRLQLMRKIARSLAGEEFGETGQLDGFERALNDDFDTPRALEWAERMLKAAAREANRERALALAAPAIRGLRILGVDLLENS